jgi:hypothetical protein
MKALCEPYTREESLDANRQYLGEEFAKTVDERNGLVVLDAISLG